MCDGVGCLWWELFWGEEIAGSGSSVFYLLQSPLAKRETYTEFVVHIDYLRIVLSMDNLDNLR